MDIKKVYLWSWELRFDLKKWKKGEFCRAFITSRGLHILVPIFMTVTQPPTADEGCKSRLKAPENPEHFFNATKTSKHTLTPLWCPSSLFVHRCWWRKTNAWKWSCPEPRWRWLKLRWRRTRCCTAWRTSKSTPARAGSLFFTPRKSERGGQQNN